MKNQDQEFEVRVNASVALGKTKLNAFKVLDPLRETLDNESALLRMTAAFAIAEISKDEVGLEEAYTKKAALVLTPYLSENADPFDR